MKKIPFSFANMSDWSLKKLSEMSEILMGENARFMLAIPLLQNFS